MIAPNLISDYIAPLQVSDSGEHALVMMHEQNINQLPVIEGQKYVGIITMDQVINLKHLSKPLEKFADSFHRPFVMNTDHIFDIMKTAVEFNVRMVPVVDEESNYIGSISAESCLRSFALLNSVKEAGGILELEKGLKEYSLSEIARIVEDNEAAILCLYTNVEKNSSKMQITIKLNTTNLASIVSTFERYNYEIIAIHNEKEYTEDLKDRYDALMRYLNV